MILSALDRSFIIKRYTNLRLHLQLLKTGSALISVASWLLQSVVSVCVKVVPDGESSSHGSYQPDSGPETANPKAAGLSPRQDHVEVHVNEDVNARQQRPKQVAVYTQVIPSKMRNKALTAPTVDHAAEQTVQPSTTTDLEDHGNSTEKPCTQSRPSIPTYENFRLGETV